MSEIAIGLLEMRLDKAEARLASLEAVVKQMGPQTAEPAPDRVESPSRFKIRQAANRIAMSTVEPAPAEKPVRLPGCWSEPHPFRDNDEDDLCGDCRGTIRDPIHAPAVPTAEPAVYGYIKDVRESIVTGRHVQTAEPARCSCGHSRGEHFELDGTNDGTACEGETNSRTGMCNCFEFRPCNPAPESTPDVPGFLTPYSDETLTAITKANEKAMPQPIPPRPEVQGTVTLSHQDANALLDIIEDYGSASDSGEAAMSDLSRYVDEQAARDKAQAERIAELESELDAEVAQTNKLRAELAALKQPAPSRKTPPGTAPAQTDGTGSGDAAADFLTDHRVDFDFDSEQWKLALADLTKRFDEAEQRGRASRDDMCDTCAGREALAMEFPGRDGVVPAGAVEALREWRALQDSDRVFIDAMLAKLSVDVSDNGGANQNARGINLVRRVIASLAGELQ